MTTSDRIKKARMDKGLTLEQVANYVGVSKPTVLRWETGDIKNMRRDKIAKLAEILNVSPDYIIGINSDNAREETISKHLRPITRKRFRVFGEIACGTPIFAEEDYESYIDASADIKADFCLIARGDSMINARIYDGDVVFIKQQEMVANGQIAAVIIDDEATLKRWYYYPEENRLVLMPENPRYEPKIFIGEELNHITCLGRAVCFMSNL